MSAELSCVTTDHKSSIRVRRKTLIRWYFGVQHCLSLVTRLMLVMFSMGWCKATNISICSGSQVTDRMTTWQGRGMCDGEINLFGTNLDKNHSLYRRLPRSCAIPRAFWTRVGAIRCNYPGRKHRKVRIIVPWSLSEGSHSLRRPDLGKVRGKILRENIEMADWKLNGPVCTKIVLFYSSTKIMG